MSYRASPQLEEYILDHAPEYLALPAGLAPESFAELNAECTGRKWNTPLPILATKDTDLTIYSEPAVNDALRAQHDLVHFNEQLDFSLHDELEVVRQQVLDIESMAGEYGLTEEDIEAFFIDLAGQRMYYELHGEYVVEQDRFVRQCLSHGLGFTLGSMEVF